MASRTYILSAIALVCLSVAANSLTCPDGYRPYSCTSDACGCLRLSEDEDTVDFDAARAVCSSEGSLALVRTSTELGVVQRYLEVFGDDGEYLWTGYQYSTSQGEFVGVDGEGASSTVTDNIGSTSGAGEDDLCLSIGSDGMFRNDSCSSTLGYICLMEYGVPEPTISTSATGVLSDGMSITLTCTYPNGMGDWRVRKTGSDDYVVDTEGTRGVGSSDSITLTVTVGTNDGEYECVVESVVGTAVSKSYGIRSGLDSTAPSPSINTFDLSYGSVSGLDNSEIRTVPFGEEITIPCGFTSGASASWYINGQEMDATTSSAQSSTLTTTLEVGGVYQCRVTDDSTGLSAVESFTLFGADGTPGPVRFIAATPSKQTSIQVSWFPPHFLAVNDPALLRYQLAYNTEDTFKRDDDSTWFLSSEILPHTDESVAMTHNLGSLSPGVKYSIAILAKSSTGDISTPRYVASALTFGLVPTDDIQNLAVNRNAANNTIVAFWDPITTNLPYQPVQFYQFQYRDIATRGGTVELPYSTGTVARGFSYAVIPNVKNANDYEFRVRAVYEISDVPDYEYSKWTPWTKVQGVTPTVPPVPPTGGLDGDDDDDVEPEVIAAAVVGPVLLVLLVAAIILVAVFYTASLRRGEGKEDPEKRGRVRSDAQELTPSFRLNCDEKPH